MMRHARRLWRLTSAATLLGLGCDGALVEGSYHGEPLLTVSGEVRLVGKSTSGGEEPDGFPAGTLKLAVVWLGPRSESSTELVLTVIDQRITLVPVFPARYSLALYSPPPPTASLGAGTSGTYAVAVLAAYVDANGNGRFDRDVDRLIGGATGQRVILYTASGLQASWLDRSLAPGYHRLIVGGGQSCKKWGHVGMQVDPLDETEIKIFAEPPADLFPDVDCDSQGGDFVAGCPTPYKVAIDCAKGKADPYVCSNCPTLP